MGVQVKDLEIGLLDFPCLVDGKSSCFAGAGRRNDYALARTKRVSRGARQSTRALQTRAVVDEEEAFTKLLWIEKGRCFRQRLFYLRERPLLHRQSVVEAFTPLKLAPMVVVPVKTPVASPLLLMVAVGWLLDVQVVDVVTSAVVLSEYVAVAVNCCVDPVSTVPFDGEIASELTTLLLMVSVVFCVMPLSVPEIAVLPMATPDASPEASIVATTGFDELQVTFAVMSRVVPSPKNPLPRTEWWCLA